MKIVIGPGQHDLMLYDNDGDNIEVFVTALEITLRPDQPTQVTMTLIVDEVVADMPDADIILTAKELFRKKTEPLSVCPS